jgi:DNA-binding NarL/FixJ family response regulator
VYSILIIEDDAQYRNSMELILKLEGFCVRTADTGIAGIAGGREKRPDLILCDIMMPGMDGHTVLELLQSEKTLADVPFIFVTALNSRAEVRRGMSEGADDYLTKPFSSDELIATVVGRLRKFENIRMHNTRPAFEKSQAILRQQITGREREVLLLVGNGATSKEIADQLGIRLNTVEVHRSNLMKKLNATNAAILARWAFIAELDDGV